MLHNIHLERILFLDIETVPAQATFESLTPYEQQLWVDKRGRFKPEDMSNSAYYFQQAAIFAEFGRIICISAGYFKNNSFNTFNINTTKSDNEKDILIEFADWINKFQKKWDGNMLLCGHNIKEFDIPYICRRYLANGLVSAFPNYLQRLRDLKPWDSPLLDTMDIWRFGDYKNFISLKLLAHILQVPSPKNDISGADVANVYYEDKDISRIKKYCARDVLTLAQILLKVKGLPIMDEENVQFLAG
jgi:uncharacterized protein YprB with RNaseH-like and TPR domain